MLNPFLKRFHARNSPTVHRLKSMDLWYISAIMLKALAILTVMIIGLAVFVAIQDEKATQQNKAKATNHDKSLDKPAIPVAGPSGTEQPQENIEKPEWNLPGWYGFFRWPNGTTTWAILLTLWAVAWQSNETKKTAEAALLNAQAIINAERSRIFVKQRTTQDAQLLSFDFEITNHGRSACALCYYFAARKTLYDGQELPPEPLYGDVREYGRRKNEWILPNVEKPFILPNLEELILTQESEGKEFTDIKEGKAKLWIYGVVRYEDGIAPSGHETRFCYYWAGKFGLIAGGPDAYRRVT
jgi:hypothetical protein